MKKRSQKITGWLFFLSLSILFLSGESLQAARIGELVETDVWMQAKRFFSFRDPSLQIALLGTLLLGLNGGLLGGYVLVRRMALLGDTLSHAVLPGIALGFLWNMNKDPLAIVVGATLAGLLGVLVVTWIGRTTCLKPDAAMGLVLSSFYAVGICLLTMIQRLPTGNKSGLDTFLFGQAAALVYEDIVLIGICCALTILILSFFYKGLLLLSFDRAYGEAVGVPVSFLHYLLMFLTALGIVVAMQAVGVVLVSALLVIPPATAYLLTDRFHRMLIYSALLGMLSAALGAFISFLGNHLPTGPFIVLGGGVFFAIAFLVSPKHGWIVRALNHHKRRKRVEQENLLKSIYHIMERANFKEKLVELSALKRESTEKKDRLRPCFKRLLQKQFVEKKTESAFILTPKGYERAKQIVRNHRLWELYLTNVADYPADHVHADAEIIEHVLSEETLRELEEKLDFPQKDPHGMLIP